MKRQTFNSVWDALEDTKAEAMNMRIRSALMTDIANHIKEQGWGQKEASERLGLTQPRVSDLVRGKIDKFSLDALVNMVSAMGLDVEIKVA
jgi:predicted XRE-type DNA-binding protein